MDHDFESGCEPESRDVAGGEFVFDETVGVGNKILFTCATAKDISVGAALAALCLHFNGDGSLCQSKDGRSAKIIDKVFIRQRLAWITTSKADANPSRETLQAVNSYLMRR